MRTVDVVVIGGGSAGMAAAISCYDSGVKDILILEKSDKLGGILNQCIHNGFGLTEFKEELTGPEFLTRFANQVKERGIEYKLNSFVTSINKEKEVTYINSVDGNVTIKAKAVIVATGCYERSAGAIAIPGSRPTGVITAGQAQLYLNIHGYLVGKKIFILGSGDIGLIMARRMTLEGAKVLGVAELMPYSNGLNRNIVQCLKDYDIPLYLSHTVSKVIGSDRLEAIELSQVDDKLVPIPGTEQRIECDTLLLSIGLIPNSKLLCDAGASISRTNGADVNELTETSISGVFSCGNVLHVHDLVDFVVEEARISGRGAAYYVKGELDDCACQILSKPGNGIGYVVPELIHTSPKEDVMLKFRVRTPSKNKKIIVRLNDNIIKIQPKIAVIPSEMEMVKISKDLLKEPGELTITLEDM